MLYQTKYHFLKWLISFVLIAGVLLSCGTKPSAGSQTRTTTGSAVAQNSAEEQSSGSQTKTTTTTSPATPQNKAEIQSRQSLYMAHLRNEGYVPSIDEDGDIAFKREGLTYYIGIVENDPSFTEIVLMNIISLNNDRDRARAAAAVSFANSNTKGAKAYISGSQNQFVSIAMEVFLENPNDFTALFSRYLRAIDSAKEDFESKM